MKNELPSLITPDAKTGLALASELASQLRTQFEKAGSQADHPGGTNYLVRPSVSSEVIGSVLFYAIAAANQGWSEASVQKSQA
jgi:hypothetical protein